MDESGSDDVLGLVLERVDSQVSLIRAAAVCRRWRRAIADAAFLRRYRSLHAPSVAGEYHNGAWRSDEGPVFVPSSPSMVDARHFSLDFLPNGAGACLRAPDAPLRDHPSTGRAAVDIDAGCPCLIDGIGIEAGSRISMSNFRVLCMFLCHGFTHTAMLTVGSSWNEKSICHAAPNFHSTSFLGRAGGSQYFCAEGRTLVHLDCSTGDFTSSAIKDLDFDQERCNIFVTELRDGKPHIITVSNNTLKVFERLDSGEWALQKSALLPEVTHQLPGYKPSFFYSDQEILARGKGFVILSPQSADSWQYSVDLETMEVELTTCDMKPIVYRYELPWPPALHARLDR
ncbi:unnamed protein product [Urochloa decumbens]|uniref:F-box domain-containing protein n=1 Tax=Urochloa decumbens TaxID=240449 RepID=A0ABC8VI70_9POAL